MEGGRNDDTGRYILDDGTVVRFEESGPGFGPASGQDVVGKIEEAAARADLGGQGAAGKARAARPGEVDVKFGVKVTGTAYWIFVKAATEGNFEITLTWKGGGGRS